MSTNKVLHGPVFGVWAKRPPHPGTRMGSLSQSATKYRASVSVDGLRLPFLSSELENAYLILQSYLISIHLVMILRKPGQCGKPGQCVNARTGDVARWAGPAKQWTDGSAARRGTAVGELDRWAAAEQQTGGAKQASATDEQAEPRQAEPRQTAARWARQGKAAGAPAE